MLPGVQMHRLVQPSPNLDALPPQLNHCHMSHAINDHNSLDASGRNVPRSISNAPAQRAFPIRTSHSLLPHYGHVPAPTSGPSHRTAAAEYRLRRKTPGGTIDAGYDASPAHHASGPPALKHMILSMPPSRPSNQVPHLPSGPFNQQIVLRDEANRARIGGAIDSRSLPQRNVAQSVDHHQTIFPLPTDLSSPYFPVQSTPGQANYQQLPQGPRSGVHLWVQDNGLCPPGAPITAEPWVDDLTPSHHQGLGFLQQQQEFGHPSYSPQCLASATPIQPGIPATNVPSFPPSSLTFGPPNGLSPPYLGSGSHMSRAPFLNFGNLSLGAALPSNVPLGFKDKTLAQAHRAYVDLLAYLHHARKYQLSAGGLGPGAKSLIFPKPPKQASQLSRTSKVASAHRATSTGSHNVGVSGSSTSRQNCTLPPCVGPGQWGMNVPLAPQSMPSMRNAASPLLQAKTSLEILTQICERSEWQWVDGMMLGGCLHFGLDQYETALEWFARVVAIDASNTEALSNMATALYCLDQHDEAEQAWLQAVRISPGMLEAVEHLVGLLYKKRGHDAIRIIGFVQTSLRIPRPSDADALTAQSSTPLLASADTQAPGFGSSGYAIPGSENGRVLALVHAKGTILYGLKDIEQASRAFEEAVLISAGRVIDGVEDLVGRIQHVLSPDCEARGSGTRIPALLLPPEKARLTAKLVFTGNGELAGLRYMSDGGAKRAAIQTTSNSLLSLAKIFQDAISSGTVSPSLLRRPLGIPDILSLYYLSLSLQESPSTANNVGILLASVQQSATPRSTRHYATEATQRPSIPGVPPGSGLALALSYYNYGLALDPKHVHLHTNLGSLLKDIGQLDLAIQMYEKAVACDGNFDIALTNLANAVKDRGRVSDAISYYKRAVSSNPNFAEAVCGLSTALNSVCDWRGRGGVVLQSGKYDRWHVDDNGMLVDSQVKRQGDGLTQRVVDIVRKQLEDAQTWGIGTLHGESIKVLAQKAQRFSVDASITEEHWTSLLNSWSQRRGEGSRILRLVERLTRSTMRQWYCDKYGVGSSSSTTEYGRVPLPASLTIPSAPTVLPFHTFTCPLTARDIRMISQRNALRISYSTLRSAWLPNSVYPPPPPPSPQLKVGYVSSDFNNHPLAHLMQSVFGFHDTKKVLAFCYATTASDKSVHRLQIEREAPVFRDVSGWSSDRLVNQIVEDGIHVLVNLNGYTRGARNEIFAARPAPIQMSFMGFAGTMGAEWCDYVLADTIAIPPETLRPWRGNLGVRGLFQDGMDDDARSEWVYSENVIFCRDTFFCCDHAQSSEPEEHRVSWVDEQRRRWRMRKELFPALPDDTVIMANFNQLYKIDPSTFRTWLRILSHVPKAVLWLLRFPELGEANLRRTARAWAGTEVANRIIFTDVAPKNQHISRARVCDLFLDTPECNAHTTAADVLWSSTPLLTLPRYPFKMCSRMAASILRGALPRNTKGREAAEELIAADEDEYEKLATRLANDLTYNVGKEYAEGVGRLAEMRQLLWESKWSCPLFDTRRWVIDLEKAYQEAWRKWVAGEEGDIYL